MFTNFAKRIVSSQKSIIPNLNRNITKTTSVPQSDIISRANNEQKIEDKTPRKLLQLKKYHRLLSTLQSTAIPPVVTGSVVSKQEKREFMAVFPDIVRDLTNSGRYKDIPDVSKWLAKVLQYNVPNGKKNRGLALVAAYKLLAKPEDFTQENHRLAIILGWCVEMLQGHFLVADDIMDGAEKRRGMPCWYKVPEVGMNAVNDSILLYNCIFIILKKHFQDKSCYIDLLNLFHETAFNTGIGQYLDLYSCGKKSSLDLFTMDRYDAITKYKTAYYSFQLPVALAMYWAGINDPEMHRQASSIMLEMGHFFQIQDDFLDCFGDVDVTGKTNNDMDIRDGKCTWLAVVALQRASPEQRKILENCYGSDDPNDAATVRELYEKLNIPHIYAVYEEESYNLLRTHIQQISRGLPHALFFKFLDKIYRRDH